MQSRLFHATLSAALLLAPMTSRLLAADEPAAPATRSSLVARLDPAILINRIENALKEMNLPEEQNAKIKDLIARARKSVEETKEGPARDKIQAVSKAIGEIRDGLKGLLSEDQLKALSEKLPMLNRVGAGAGNPDGPSAGQRLLQAALEKLTLTDDQKAKIKAISDEFEQKTKDLIQESKGDRAAITDKIRSLMEDRRTAIVNLLSPEQKAKLQDAIRELRSEIQPNGPATKPTEK